jgi:hypothetical protein
MERFHLNHQQNPVRTEDFVGLKEEVHGSRPGDSHTIPHKVPDLLTVPGSVRFNVLEFELVYGMVKVLRNSTFS